MEAGDQRRERLRDLALAIALYPVRDEGMLQEGARFVEELGAQETGVRNAFTVWLGADTAMLETAAFANADDMLARAGWLAYLARHDAARYAGRFAAEWRRFNHYRDWCDRTIDERTDAMRLTGDAYARFAEPWQGMSERFRALGTLLEADVSRLVTAGDPATRSALAEARFGAEARAIINLLGGLEPSAAALGEARHPLLREFIAARRPE